MSYQLNLFEKIMKANPNAAFVSIGNGQIYFNVRVMELMGYDTRWIRLDISKKDKKLEVKPLKRRSTRARPLKAVSNQTKAKILHDSRFIKAKLAPLLGDIEGKSKKYPAEWLEEDGVLVIDLNYELV